MATAYTSRFPSTLQKMIRSIGPTQKVVTHNRSAKDWLRDVNYARRVHFDRVLHAANNSAIRVHLDQVITYLIEQDYDFSERKEHEVSRTVKEAVGNSSFACREKEDLYVELTTHIGESGLVAHIKDDGPGFDHKRKLEERRRTLLKYPDEMFLYGITRDDFPGGAGLSCLLRFPDEFHYNPEGNELAIRFQLQKLRNP